MSSTSRKSKYFLSAALVWMPCPLPIIPVYVISSDLQAAMSIILKDISMGDDHGDGIDPINIGIQSYTLLPQPYRQPGSPGLSNVHGHTATSSHKMVLPYVSHTVMRTVYTFTASFHHQMLPN